MSRPKIPNVSWRQLRIAVALFLAGLLTAAILAPKADAKDHHPTHDNKAALTPAMTPLRDILRSDHLHLVTALGLQSQAQAKAHRQAAAEAAAKHRAAKAKAAAQHRAQEQAAAKRRAAQAAEHQRSAPTRSSRTRHRAAPQSATVSGARAYAQSRMSPAQFQCLSSLVSRESGWNHRASNPSSGAYGLFQALPGSKMSSAGSDWQSNPLTQMRWGLSYIQDRYGNPCAAWNFWQENGWY